MTEKTLEELFPLGSEFNYLGRTLRVKKHYIVVDVGLSTGDIPALVCNYADANGIIREVIIEQDDARELKIMNHRLADRYNAANQAISYYSNAPRGLGDA